jgi:hypothetical protein
MTNTTAGPNTVAAAAPPQRQESTASLPPPRSFQEKITDKAVAAAWVLVAVATAYWTDTVSVLVLRQADSESSATATAAAVRGLLQIVAVGFGINTVLVAYLTVYLPYVKGLTDSSAWPVYCPRVIPTMTLTGVLTALLLIRAVWPVWGFLSPLILGIQAMGCLFSLHFIPVWPQS